MPQYLEFKTRHSGHIVADARGNPEHPAVLFLHGGGQTRHAWAKSAQTLADAGWYTVSLDLPGHGDSGWMKDGDYSRQRLLDDVRCVLDELNTVAGRKLAVVGASMGGLLSFATAASSETPPYDALIMVDVAPRIEEAGVDRVIAFMRESVDGFDSLEAAADYIAAYVPHRKRPKNLDGLKKNLRQDDEGRWRWHWDPALFSQPKVSDPDGRRKMYELAASRMKIPALLIRGRMSDMLSDAGVEDFLNLVPHGEYVNLKGAAHMVAGDVNDAFTDTVADFLTRAFPSDDSR